MIVNIIFFGFFAAALAEGSNSDRDGHLETLRVKAEEGSRKVLETIEDVNNSGKYYDDYLKERIECLLWECTVQKEILNKTIAKAVIKGISKNKQFTNFQCISKSTKDAFDKLDEIKSQVPVDSENIKLKRLEAVTSLGLILSALDDYVQDLYKTKVEEMKKATSENAMKKILEEFLRAMSRLNIILDQTNDHVKDTKFKFISDYINYAFVTEKKLRSIQRDGTQNILKCVA